jgi:hypothetical protein
VAAFNNGAVVEGILNLMAALIFIGLAAYFLREVIRVIRNAYGTNFQKANLTGAVFRKALVHNTTFADSSLKWVDWEGADVARSSFEITPVFQLELDRKSGCRSNYENADFENLFLNGASLIEANLRGTNLSGAKFQRADFRDADLTGAKAAGTDFSDANLTGAIIEGWAITKQTLFKGVHCDYVYLRGDRDPQSRKPLSGIFEPGDFEKIVNHLTESLDFLFHEEDDPRVYSQALQTMMATYGPQNIQLAGLEELGDGDRLFKFNTAPDLDKAKVHAETIALIAELRLKAATAEEQVAFLRTFMSNDLPKLLSGRQGDNTYINVETYGMNKQHVKNTGSGDIIGIAGGDLSGVVGKDIQGSAGRDLSGQVMLSIEALRQSDIAAAPTLADLLTQLKTIIDRSDLPDAAKAEAQNHLEQLAKAPTLPTAEGIKEAADKSISFFKTISLIIPSLSDAINQLLGQIVNLCGWGG